MMNPPAPTRAASTALLLAMAALALPGAASAQGVNLQLLPKAGISVPMGTLGDNSEIATAPALGLAAELTLPALPLNLRANLEYGHTADIVERSHAETVLGEAAILAVTGDIVLRPLPATAVAQPYFLGGAGVKSYDIAVAPAAGPELRAVEGTTRRWALHVGGGLDVRFGPLSFVLEVSDYVSTFPVGEDSRVQHDVFGMLGFRVTMF